MIWRAAAILVVLFWAVMSGLLVRDIYFPESSRFARLPPRVVLDRFLRQSQTFGSTLHLYHHREKTGHASFQISRRVKPNHETVYDLMANGVVEEPGQGGGADVLWSLACVLADAERWQQVTMSVDLPKRKASAMLAWNEHQKTPEVLVKHDGRVVMDTADAAKILSLGTDGALSLLSTMGGLPKPGADGQPALHAREGVMKLAGRERKCFVVTLPLIGPHEARMIFTEGGEIARIELPEGHTLLEPMIYGMEDANR